jgi:UDP-N-acetyl-D-mannosaminuronic acid dehydrogenase
VDTNPRVVNLLRQGEIHIEEPGLATVVKAAIASHNLSIDDKPAPADVFIIAVPTPYHHSDGGIPKADLSYVEAALQSILPHLRAGNLVILESTSPPGTTRDLVVPMIAKNTQFTPGRDIGVAYCPERVIPGLALKELIENDRVVGSIDQAWGEKTKKLYKSFVEGEIFITDPTVAEMVKIVENTYRDVNIALANEIALLCEKLSINVWDVIHIANRHPRVNVHRPGPGVGGHCISVDPWFLVEKFPDQARLIHLARKTNDAMPGHVVSAIERLLAGRDKAKIAVLGLAYKANVDDARESPALIIVDALRQRRPRWELALYDPHVSLKDYPTQGIQDAFRGADLALVLTAHDEIRFLDPEEVGPLMSTRLVFDTHNALKAERWVPAGFVLHTLGAGATSEPQGAVVS